MNIDFAALLFGLTVLTGGIWLLDTWLFAPRRARLVSAGHAQAGQPTVAELPWYVDVSKSFFPVILAVLVLRSFVVEPFRIPSDSMVPTLLNGDFILVNKFSYGLRLPVLNTKIMGNGLPERGDVAVFRYPKNPSVAYIKRVIGLPGDRLEYRHQQLFINGQPVPLEILSSQPPAYPESGYGYRRFEEQLGQIDHAIQVQARERWRVLALWRGLQVREEPDGHIAWSYQVPSGHYFMMGDNRDNSSDSRFWGPLPEENLIGKAFFIWMNWDCVTFNGQCSRIGNHIQ
ncbi:MAG: signal peptidase I [Candidatus Contendobacter odensis]|uniref:Signal peptidase I n=1 Tax=Candidatus Contendibacter odensensis TaxID=1400860 RepID=A0A2G6PFP0_9GAMM|nr:MAG: signal peptidase I [Candidatus Contendobacter odensis]